MRTVFRVTIVAVIAAAAALAQNSDVATRWANWKPFLGTWEGTGGGAPGQGKGSFTFSPDLQGVVLTRRNYSEYPARKDRAAYRHDDFVVIYLDADKKTRADYWDNEDHLIHYTIDFTDNGDRMVWVSDPARPGPRFRLTYAKTAADALSLKFEIAPPNAPTEFKTYVEAAAKRTAK